MEKPISPLLLARFQAKAPWEWLLLWVEVVKAREQQYSNWKQQGILEDLVGPNDQLLDILPYEVEQEKLKQLYSRLVQIHAFMEAPEIQPSSIKQHSSLFRACEPVLARYYEVIRQNYPTIRIALATIMTTHHVEPLEVTLAT